jgi:LPXTG-motif cell wall-anchored protein
MLLSSISIIANAETVNMYGSLSTTDSWWTSTLTLSYKTINNSGVITTYNVTEHLGYSIPTFEVNNNDNTKSIAYCIAPGGPLHNGSEVIKFDSGSTTFYNQLIEANQGLEQALGLVMYYGYGGAKDKTLSSGNKYLRGIATQVLIWEFITNKRPLTGDFGINNSNTDIVKNIRYWGGTSKDTVYNNYMKPILQAMIDHTKRPSFSKSKENAAKANVITLKYNTTSKKYEYTTAADAQTSQYTWTCTNSNVNIIVTNDNKLKISSSVSIKDPIIIKGEKKIDRNVKNYNGVKGTENNTKVVWGKWNETSEGNGNYNHRQVIVSGTYVDPPKAYIAIKTDTGNIKITKHFYDYKDNYTNIDDDIAKSLHYLIKVKNSGKYIQVSKESDGTYKYNSTSNITDPTQLNNNYKMTLKIPNTGTGYTIDIKNLPPNTYTIVEYKDNAYYKSGYAVVEDNYEDVTVTSNSTSNVDFKNKPTQVIITKDIKQEYDVIKSDFEGIYLNINDGNTVIRFKRNTTSTPTNSSTGRKCKVYEYDKTATENGSGGITNLTFINDSDSTDSNVYDIKLVGLPYTSSGKTYTVTEGGTNSGKFTFNGKNIVVKETNNSPTTPYRITETNVRKNDGQIHITKNIYANNTNANSKMNENDLVYIGSDNNTDVTLKVSEVRQQLSYTIKMLRKGTSNTYDTVRFTKSGNTYTYSTSTTNTITKLTFSGQTIINIKGLPYTKYKIIENDATVIINNKQYSLVPGVCNPQNREEIVEINQNSESNKNITFEYKNIYNTTSNLEVNKVFIDDDGNVIPLSGSLLTLSNNMHFLIHTYAGNYSTGGNIYVKINSDPVDETYTYGNNTADTTAASKENATKFVLHKVIEGGVTKYKFNVKNLPTGTTGHTYVVQEVLSSYAANTIHTLCTMDNPNSSDYNINLHDSSNLFTMKDNNSYVVTMKNKLNTGSIIIKKNSEDKDNKRTFKIQGYYNYDGSVHAINNSSYLFTDLEYIVTTEDLNNYGQYEKNNLPLMYSDDNSNGIKRVQYQIEEINCPTRYILPEPIGGIVLSSDSNYTYTAEFNNELQKGKLIIKKIIEDEKGNISSQHPLQGVAFTVQDQFGKYYMPNGITTSESYPITTDSNGEITINNLPALKYDPNTKEEVTMIYSVTEKINNVNRNMDVSENPIPITISLTEEDLENYIHRNDVEDPNNSETTLTKDNRKLEIHELLETELRVLNEHKLGNITLTKVNNYDNSVITDASFKVYKLELNTNTNTYEVVQNSEVSLIQSTYHDEEDNTDKLSGTYTATNLKVGKYLLTEDVIPLGFYQIKDSDAIFDIENDGDYIRAYTNNKGKVSFSAVSEDDSDKLYYNFPIMFDLKLIKQDSENNDPLSGAIFNLYIDSNNNGELDNEDELIGDNSNNNVGLFKDLYSTSTPENKGKYEIYNIPIKYVNTGYLRYFIKEVSPPEGYELQKDSITHEVIDTFTLEFNQTQINNIIAHSKNGNNPYTPTDTITNMKIDYGTIKNDKIYGSVHVFKYDRKTNTKLSGAEFTVYIDENNNKMYDTGEQVYGIMNEDTDDSDSDDINCTFVDGNNVSHNRPCNYELHDIPYGNYVVRETRTPGNSGDYLPNDNDYPFSIISNGDLIHLADQIVDDNDNTEDNETGIIFNGNFAPGIPNDKASGTAQVAKYTEYDYSEYANRSFDIYVTSKSTVYKSGIVANGTILTIPSMPDCGYYIKLHDANGTSEANLILHSDVFDPSPNNRGEIQVDLSKAHKPLKNVEFMLTKVDENDPQQEQTILVKKSNSKGFVTFSELSLGSYKIYETAVPSGIEMPQDTLVGTFTVTSENVKKVFRFSRLNREIEMNIKLYKVDRDNNRKYLGDAKYDLYEDNDGNGQIDSNDKRLGAFTKKSEVVNGQSIPYYAFKKLKYGDYIIVETKASKDYTIDHELHKVKITANNAVDMVIDNTNCRGVNVTLTEVKLSRLPTAGGEGTTIYIVFGMLLMSCSVLYIYKKKRKI